MKSEAKTVEEYLEALEGERKEAIAKLRELVLKIQPNMNESMKYHMPTYSQKDNYIAFASQKQYISLYIRSNELLLKYKLKLGKVSLGKNCIRFRKLADMNFDVIENLLMEV